jgi:hypothetical protein
VENKGIGSLTDEDLDTKQPRIEFISLENDNDYDFFPELENSNYKQQEQKIVSQLKNGSYKPFMQMVEYEATVKGTKYKRLEEAHPANKEYTASRDTYEQLDAAEMVELQKRVKVKSRLEILNETFKAPSIPARPRYYHNPLQYFDHVLLSDQYVNGFPGTVIDTYADFIMPKDIHPVLKLRYPEDHGNKEKQQKVIKKNQDIISKLEAVDQWYSDLGVHSEDEFMDIPLKMKWKAQIINMLTFGRDAMLFENWDHLPPVTIKKEEFRGLPNVTKLLHPIDMGMLEIDNYTWKLGGMYVHNDRNFVPAQSMLYLVNQYQSPFIGSMLYGYSKIQRALDPGRLLRRMFAQNYQQYIRASYAGMGMFIFDSSQYPAEVRTKIRTAIKNSWRAGEVGVIDYANIADFKWQEMNINVDIGGLQSLQEQLVKVIVGVMGVPQSLIFDESAATRATLVGKIVSFINNQVTSLRESIGSQIASQWYNRVFREVYKDQKDILEQFYIECEFEEMELETKLEKVGRLIQEQQLGNKYTNEYLGEELGDSDYLNHIDEKKTQEAQMGPQEGGGAFGKGGKGQFSVTDSSTGQNVSVSKES